MMNKLYFIYKIRKLSRPVLVWLQTLTYDKVKNFLISLFITIIVINTSFCLLYYIYDYNPSIYIRTSINIFLILPVVRSITSKTYLGNYCTKDGKGKGKGKRLHAVVHYLKTGFYSYTFSITYIWFGISEVVYIPLIGFMVITVLYMDIQILESPDYCMGPKEERSLTVGKNTSSELSKRVVETESSKSSSVTKRSPFQAFPLPSLSLEERKGKRIRYAIKYGRNVVDDLPDNSIEDVNGKFIPII